MANGERGITSTPLNEHSCHMIVNRLEHEPKKLKNLCFNLLMRMIYGTDSPYYTEVEYKRYDEEVQKIIKGIFAP